MIYPTLTWEKDYPERSVWTKILVDALTGLPSQILGTASDILTIRSDFNTLTDMQKTNVLAQFFCSDAFFESGWDPAENSQDVGSEDDKNSWSVGLWQMSVCDQANYNLNSGYSFEDLQTVGPNASLAIAIMTTQVKKHGIILVPWSNRDWVYWSTLSPGNKYYKGDEIIADVQAMKL